MSHHRNGTDSAIITTLKGENSPSGVASYVNAFKAAPSLGKHIVHHHIFREREARYCKTSKPLSAEIESFLRMAGIDALYSHQAEAIDAARRGKNVVIATSTASGKTLSYNIPVLERIIQRPDSKALYLFPLKALANDQLASFRRMAQCTVPHMNIQCAIYDGDTSQWDRKKIRNDPPSLIFTNPDMLHLAMLPYHSSWAKFFENLEFVVVDEVHTYRGLFGSHMAWVFRRLRRICKRYGADPVFIFCSATVGNPDSLATGLTGLEVECIKESGAPSGRRHFLMVDPQLSGAAQMAVQLLIAALHRKLRTIVYTQSRKLTELINLWASERAGKYAKRISAYRAGFLPEERRDIESAMSDGRLLAVISTSALELGIDIGSLDICILVGYPGTIMSTWQRGGRVGRSMRESAVILIAQEDALDRYFLNHPEELIQRSAEAAVINPLNSFIMSKHLLCAAAELPISRKEESVALPQVQSALNELEHQGKLLSSADGSELFCSRRYPQREVNLRGTGQTYQIISGDTGEIIGSVDGFRAMRETHPGAIYIHRGEQFLVKELDLERHHAVVFPARVNYFTKVTATKDTEILEIFENRQIGQATFYLGRLKVTDRVTGYERRLVRGQRLAGREELDLPPQIFETEGLWFTLPESLTREVEQRQMHLMGGIHALEHAVIGILPLFVLTDRNDLGGISFTMHPQCATSAVFVYDGVPGGIGLAREAFSRAKQVMERVIATIKECQCENGCPSCVHSPKCGSGNRPIDKEAALYVAGQMLKKERAEGKPHIKIAAGVQGVEMTSSRREPPTAPSQPEQRHASNMKVDDGKAFRLPDDYIVFDVETQRSAAEVGGWNMAHLMKVSCVVMYSSLDDRFHTFLEDQLHDFFHRLARTELVVGFNIKRFDYRVIGAYTDMDLHRLPTLDMLETVHRRLGYRLSLNGIASATLGAKKSADGLLALKWWKQGRMDLITEYCRKDVEITRDLLKFAQKHGYLLFRNKAGNLVRLPFQPDLGKSSINT